MGGVFDNVRPHKVYPKVKIDDGLGDGLSLGLDIVVSALTVMVGVDDASSSFFVGVGYVEIVRWRSRWLCEEETVESSTWIARR